MRLPCLKRVSEGGGRDISPLIAGGRAVVETVWEDDETGW